jgi:hypothetical protein
MAINPCSNIIGVKNILMTFNDCDRNLKIGPISHKLATNDLPTIRACDHKSEMLPGGYVKRVQDSALMELKVIRDIRIPLSYYQGCAAVDIQIEYLNGDVFTGINGNSTGDTQSDTHQVDMKMTFLSIDELLPTGGLIAA